MVHDRRSALPWTTGTSFRNIESGVLLLRRVAEIYSGVDMHGRSVRTCWSAAHSRGYTSRVAQWHFKLTSLSGDRSMKLKLTFHSPEWLNNLDKTSTREPPIWTISGVDSDDLAFIDIEQMTIVNDTGDRSVPLKEVLIYQQKNRFYLPKNEDLEDNAQEVGARPIDFTFASSMLGQLLKGDDLISALKSLSFHFELMKGSGETDDGQPENDSNKKEDENSSNEKS